MNFSNQVIDFYYSLKLRGPLLQEVNVMNPYIDPDVKKIVESFYPAFYSDNRKRIFIFGINPGRHGAGVTGIPFTDPIRLAEVCGIRHSLPMRQELSSVFVYKVIQAYGGIHQFNHDFFLTAVCPLGFTREGKNMNYYDDANLQSTLHDFIVNSIRKQISFGTTSQFCICLGEGKNYKYLLSLNKSENFFSEIIPLPHPRWVMQYRLKSMDEYINTFVTTFSKLKLQMA